MVPVCGNPSAGASAPTRLPDATAVRRGLREFSRGLEEWSPGVDLQQLNETGNGRPYPVLSPVIVERGNTTVAIEFKAVNHSPHPAPAGYLTVTFVLPEMVEPEDLDLVVKASEGMRVVRVLPGEPIYARGGQLLSSDRLLIEAQGEWPAQSGHWIRLTMPEVQLPQAFQYRSTLQDQSGRFLNSPRESDMLDQQGWAVSGCTMRDAPIRLAAP